VVRLGPADLARIPLAAHRGRRRDRHGGLHVPRAGPRQGRGLPLGPVHAGCDPLRARHGLPGLQARDRGPDHRGHHRGPARAARDPEPGAPVPAALGDRALSRQGPRRALRLDARPRARAARTAGASGGGRRVRRVGSAPLRALPAARPRTRSRSSPARSRRGRAFGEPPSWNESRSPSECAPCPPRSASRSCRSGRWRRMRPTARWPRGSWTCSRLASHPSNAFRAASGWSLPPTSCRPASRAPKRPAAGSASRSWSPGASSASRASCC
jgi:hypothetical protein